MIYFDNAATTFPKPPQLFDAFADYLKRCGANPGRAGHGMSIETAQRIYSVRDAVGRLLGAASPDQVVFTQNCTHSINLVLKGLLRWGDHVILSDLEHNAVLRPLHRMWMENGIQYSIAKVVEGDDDATVRNFEQLFCTDTRLVVCTHASNTFGIKLPIERLAQLAHRHGALFLADCAQTAGTAEIHAQRMGLDFVAAPGHKGLYGPTGTGVLIMNTDVVLSTLMEGGTGSNSLDYNQPDFLPDRLESGTINTAGILALGAGVEYVRRCGEREIYLHELHLAQQLWEGLQKLPRVKLYTGRPCERAHLPVLSFTIEGEHSEQTARRLSERGVATRGGYHCAPLAHQKMGTLQTGTVRVSFGAFNQEHEVMDFLTILKILQNT